ncbi:MAG: ABC transporter substrate-binding protein [Gaiellaceae bacterium]
MARRLWLGVGALALGAAMLVAAQLASASRGFRHGGILNVGFVGASPQVDPQLSWITAGWWLEYATAAKLYNYPDHPGQAGALLRPEVASGYTVSRDGRTYTFAIRRGFRFSDGSPVTAKNFAYAIDRAANHSLASPAAPFITDPGGTNIVGAKRVNDGKATHVRGVVAKGYRLVIQLTRRDPTLLTKLAMPFFQATSTTLPLTKEKLSGYPSAGPYAFVNNVPDELTQLRRNRYYRGGRPHRLDGVDVRWSLEPETGYRQVVSGELDEGPLPDGEVAGVAQQYHINKSRLWVEPTDCLGYLAINTLRPEFRGNVALRRALNWAVDRRAALAYVPPYSASPWTHLLPPGTPGSITAKNRQPYAGAPNLSKARRLAAGHVRHGVVTVGYRSTTASGLPQAQLVRSTLEAIGFRAADVKLKGFSGADLYDAMGHRNSNLDLGVSLGWCSDYPDPLAMLEIGFDSTESGAAKYHHRLLAAQRLSGAARLKALGELDLAITTKLAPEVVMRTYNSRYFFSERVNPRSLVYSGAYQDWSIPALALK